MNKKIIVMGGVIAMGMASNAYAVEACNATTGAVSVTGNPTSFIRDGFTPRCSANVVVNFLQDGTRVDVRGASSKGMHTFGGSSEGGGVLQCESGSVSLPATKASPTLSSPCLPAAA